MFGNTRNTKETQMFDRRIGRVGGALVGLAMIAVAVVLAVNRKPQQSGSMGGVDGRRAYRVYSQRAQATERLLIENRLDLGNE
jgi:hypothetical protein